jgi:malonate-semialdehyde dehydrogenase (acetylating)/methylmalonate-semialdehyde dehydrogenase
MANMLHHFIGGEKVAGSGGRLADVTNPATGEVTRQVPLASADEVRKAIQNAAAAQPEWAAVTPQNRARVMFRFKALIEEHMEELAELASMEHGKTLEDAKGSVQRGLEIVEYACGIAQVLKGEFSENVGTGVDSYASRHPLGVVAGITPFNFPAMVPLWMFPMAIACGNTFILKPSEKVPSCSLRLAELLLEAGAHPGVLNVVNGDKEAVDTLLHDPTIQAISFVGSTPIAEYVYTTGTANGKRVQALGGAKNHMIVMPDADLDQASDALMGAAFGSAGERCMAISVAVAVGDAVGDALVERLSPRVESLKIGPYNDPDADMGPLVSRAHYEKVRGYIDAGVEEGAKLVVDGRDFKLQGYENGNFIGGSIFDHVTPDMKIYKEEIFGPVLSIVRADNYEDALALVNDHEYGNGTAIFTRDGDAARNFTTRAKIGMVGVNVPIPVPVAYHSFGGWKRSLFGDHHMHGPEGVRFYTRLKTVTQRWPSGIRQGAEFVMPVQK